jgi:hypothetical protein
MDEDAVDEVGVVVLDSGNVIILTRLVPYIPSATVADFGDVNDPRSRAYRIPHKISG